MEQEWADNSGWHTLESNKRQKAEPSNDNAYGLDAGGWTKDCQQLTWQQQQQQ